MATLAELLRSGQWENPNNPYSKSLLADALRGSLSNAESLGRGFAVAPVGLVGDVNALAREYITPRLPAKAQEFLQSMPAAPTTEKILANIPRASDVRQETSGMEQLGAAMNTRGPIDLAQGAGKLAGEAVNEAMIYGRGPLASITPQPMKIFVPATEQEAFTASKMLKNKSPQEVWSKTGVGKWGGDFVKEISDEQAVFNTAADIASNAQKIKDRNLELKQAIKESSSKNSDLFPKELTAARKPLREEIESNQKMLDRTFGYESDPRWSGQLAAIAYEHPELYKQMPELKGVVIRQGGGDLNNNLLGSYERLPSQPVGSVDVYDLGLSKDPRSTATHEMQHAVQDVLGWQAGGNPGMFASSQEVNDAKIVANLLGKGKSPSEASKWIRENLGRSPSPQVMDIAMNPSKLEIYQGAYDPYERYKRLAGEAQARLAQSRIDLSPEERLKNYPFEYKPENYGLDVMPEELIFNDKPLGIYR